MSENYVTRTIFLQNYFAPASEMADIRRGIGDMQDLVGAMKRTELADQTLETELNAFSEHGYKIISIIQHPPDKHAKYDLLITVVLSKDD